jgi:hypothetical protein
MTCTVGSNVNLTARPAPGYEFSRWEGDVTDTGYSINIWGIDGDKSITAVFSPRTPKITATASPSKGGSISRSPDQTQYAYGSSVTLTANPASDFQFTGWEGDITGSTNPTTITMNSDKKIQAVFAPMKPCIQLSSSEIRVNVSTSHPAAAPVNIEITNGGAGTLSGLSNDCQGIARLTSSVAPTTLTVAIPDSWERQLESYPVGACSQAIITISSAAAINSPQTVLVSVTRVSDPVPYTPPPGPVNPPVYKVICAELHRQGLMDETIFKADEAFGRYLNDSDKDTLRGYLLWAKPIVKWMQKSRTFTRIVAAVATPWSYEMAYRMGARDKGSFAGRILMDAGVPLCRIIGRAIMGTSAQ